MKLLEINEFKELLSQGNTIVDTRKPEDLSGGFCKGSILILPDDNFVNTFQELVDSNQNAVLIASESDIASLSKKINYAGISNIQGFLNGGFEVLRAEIKLLDLIITVDPEEFAIDYRFDEFVLIDVRPADEFEKEHVRDAENISTSDIEALFVDIDTPESYYVYANSFYEALSAGALLRRNGVEQIKVIAADYPDIRASGVPIDRAAQNEKSSLKFSGN